MQKDTNIEAQELLQFAKNSINNKDFQNAEKFCQQLSYRFPELAEGWYLTSFLAMQTNNPQGSLEAISKAIELKPTYYQWSIHKIHLLMNFGEQDKALELAINTSRKEIDNAKSLEDLALLLSKFQYIKEAKELYQKAIVLNPKSDHLYFNLAVMQNFLGEIEAANVSCDVAISLNKFHYNAYFLRSSLTTQSVSKNHIPELESLLNARIANPIGQAQISFSLAKEYEDCKDYPTSFKVRKLGSEVYRKHMNYDFTSDISFIEKIISTYDKKTLIKASNGFENDEPIFILGLPRTGSTLVDRIISGHTDVLSAGELPNFTHQMIGMMQEISSNPNPSRTEMVTISSQLDFNQLGSNYIKSTRPQTGGQLHFTDKFPQNSLYAGLIHMALPNAKIILVERHPLDVCYAMYKQLFTEIYQFSYDQDELAEYFIAHQKLMAHWQQTIPDSIHVVRYESLVSDIESETRTALKFCNLDWQVQCLEFQNNQQVTMTASSSQVRQKLYKTSVGMWRNYEKELAPLISQLTRAGILDNWSTEQKV